MPADLQAQLDQLEKNYPAQFVLAVDLSLAATITPEMLRAVRTKFYPQLDPLVESQFWVGAFVEVSDHQTCLLDRSLVDGLRQRIPAAHLEPLWQVIASFASYRAPALALEDHLNYLALKGATAEEFAEAIKPALATLADPERKAFSGWVQQAAQRMPAGVKQTDEWQTLEKLSRVRQLSGGGPLSSDAAVDWANTLSFSGRTTQVHVRFVRRTCYLSLIASHDSFPVNCPEVTPFVVEVAIPRGARTEAKLVTLEPANSEVFTNTAMLEIIFADGQRVQVARKAPKETLPNPVILEAAEGQRTALLKAFDLKNVVGSKRAAEVPFVWAGSEAPANRGDLLVLATPDAQLLTLDIDTGQLLKLPTELQVTEHHALAMNSRYLLYAADQAVELWDLRRRTCVYRHALKSTVTCIAAHRSRRFAVGTERGVYIFPVFQGRTAAARKYQPSALDKQIQRIQQSSHIRALAWQRGELLTVDGQGQVSRWKLDGRKAERVLEHAYDRVIGPIRSISTQNNILLANRLLFGTDEGQVVLANTRRRFTEQQLLRSEGEFELYRVEGVCFLRTDALEAASYAGIGNVTLWRLDTKKRQLRPYLTWRGHADEINFMLPVGNSQLLTADTGGKVKLWRTRPRWPVAPLAVRPLQSGFELLHRDGFENLGALAPDLQAVKRRFPITTATPFGQDGMLVLGGGRKRLLKLSGTQRDEISNPIPSLEDPIVCVDPLGERIYLADRYYDQGLLTCVDTVSGNTFEASSPFYGVRALHVLNPRTLVAVGFDSRDAKDLQVQMFDTEQLDRQGRSALIEDSWVALGVSGEKLLSLTARGMLQVFSETGSRKRERLCKAALSAVISTSQQAVLESPKKLVIYRYPHKKPVVELPTFGRCVRVVGFLFEEQLLCGQAEDASLMFWHVASGGLVAVVPFSDEVSVFGDSPELLQAAFVDLSGQHQVVELSVALERLRQRAKPVVHLALGDRRAYADELEHLTPRCELRFAAIEPSGHVPESADAQVLVLSLAIGRNLRGIELALQHISDATQVIILTTPTAMQRRQRFINDLREQHPNILGAVSSYDAVLPLLNQVLQTFWQSEAVPESAAVNRVGAIREPVVRRASNPTDSRERVGPSRKAQSKSRSKKR